MSRFELKKTHDGVWCILDKSTRHPDHPGWKLTIATGNDQLEMENLMRELNRLQQAQMYTNPDELTETLD